MLRDAAVALIAARVGQRSDLNAAIILEMDLAITMTLELNPKLIPWFLESEFATTTMTPNDERLALPNDFIMECESGTLWVYNTSAAKWVRLHKNDYDTIDEKYENSAAAIPVQYSLSGNYFLLRPIPNVAYSVRMRYIAKDPTSILNTNVENRWLKHAADLVIAVTSQAVARGQVHDEVLAQSFEADIARAWERLYRLNEARQHANRDYQMGDD